MKGRRRAENLTGWTSFRNGKAQAALCSESKSLSWLP